MKLSKQLFAVMTSAAMVLSAGTTILASAEYGEVRHNISYELGVPDWVPKNYIDALEFINKHGTSYVDGEYVCIIQQRYENRSDSYDIEYSGADGGRNDVRFIYSADLRYSPDDAPDKSDTEAYET